MDARRNIQWIWWLAPCLYFGIHVIIRASLGGPLTPEEASLVAEARSMRWSYNGGLPLYPWLQWAAFRIFGETILALALVKNAIMVTIALATYLLIRQAAGARLGWAAMLSLLFLPQLVWTGQHAATPALLATAMAALTALSFARLAEHRHSLAGYLALGTAIGLGCISAPSYPWFALSLFAAAATLPHFRPVVTSPLAMSTFANAGLIAAFPYLDLLGFFSWQAWGRGEAIGYDYIMARAGGAVSLIEHTISFGAILILMATLIVYRGLGSILPENSAEAPLRRLLFRTVAAAFLLLMGHALLTGTRIDHSGMLQPLLFLAAPASVLFFYPQISPASRKWIATSACLIAAAVLLLSPAHYAYRQADKTAERPVPLGENTAVLHRL